MIALEALFVNQYVELEDAEGNMLVAQIDDIGSYSFQIGSILSKHRVSIPGLVAQEVFVYFQGGAGIKYQFKTKVIAQNGTSPIRLQLTMPQDGEILRVQKREYFRVPVELNFELENKQIGHPNRQYRTRDISGGGLSFITSERPFQDDETDPKGILFIENGESTSMIPFESRVVYQNPTTLGYQVALKFTKIRESHRDTIIKFCMKEQLKRRKL
ncbi:flagellar brake protein [Paenibacillus oralis]|nr:PilZ domain-containing protein [Paenibacillus oralis]